MNTTAMMSDDDDLLASLGITPADIEEIESRSAAVSIEQQLQQLQTVADRLRETAEQVRRGAIHPCHAANRVTKLANQLAKEKR